MLKPFTQALLILTLTASAGLASGLIRLTDRDDLYGWEAVGRVELGGGYCTGVLIAPNQVLTAAHCVFDRQNNPRPAEKIKFRAGLRDGVSIAERQVSRYVAARDYTPGAGMTNNNIRNDVALLELSEPIRTTDAAPFVLHDRDSTGSRVSVVSYGRGRDDALSWQRDCGVLQQAGGLMAFDCNTTFGSSGAPVFYKDGYRARILSLISGGTFDENGVSTMSLGMELPRVVSRLKRDLRALPAAKPPPGARFQSSNGLRSGAKSRAKFATVGGS